MEFIGSRKVKKPLPVRVVLVSPEHSMNVGMIARVVKNFSVTDLAFVKPKCKVDFEAFKFAKHSKEVLDDAKYFDNVEEATKGFDLVIGTTGVVQRFNSSLKNPIQLPELNELIVGRRVAIVFGSEGVGLSEQDLAKCDVVTTIPAEQVHPILNLSHSVAIVLYSLFFSHKTKKLYKLANNAELTALNYLFSEIVDNLHDTRPRFRNPAKSKISFKRLIGRSALAETEAQTLMAVLSRIYKKINKVNADSKSRTK